MTDTPDTSRWPIYAEAVMEAGVGAVFALPLQWGTINLGVLDLYRKAAGSLSRTQLLRRPSAADTAALLLLGLRTDPGDEQAWDQSWSSRAEIHQATGMVLAQLGVSATDAFARLRAHAFAEQRLLGDVARDVVARRLRSPRTHDTATGIGRGNAVNEAGTTGKQLLIRAFVGLADTLVDDYDVIDLLDRSAGYSVELLPADAAGILLADPHRDLRVVASPTSRPSGWSSCSCRPTRAPAWTASAPPPRSASPTWPDHPPMAPAQRRLAAALADQNPTAPYTRCRCGCAAKPSAR